MFKFIKKWGEARGRELRWKLCLSDEATHAGEPDGGDADGWRRLCAQYRVSVEA